MTDKVEEKNQTSEHAELMADAEKPTEQTGVAQKGGLPAGTATPYESDPIRQTLHEICDTLKQHQEATAQRLEELSQRVNLLCDRVLGGEQGQPPFDDEPLDECPPQLPVAVPVANPVLPKAALSHGSDWGQIIFDEFTGSDEAFVHDPGELFRDLSTGEKPAKELVGQLLLFGAAPADRMPQLLKDVGEAYYRWRPWTGDDADAMRDDLMHWLAARCQAAGVTNTIELVHPGDRFDPSRHNANQRGNQIVDVHGWVVLRDNGRVYTKASVTVR